MFLIFVISMYSLFLIPYTLYKLFHTTPEEEEMVKTWTSKKKKGEHPGGNLVTRVRNVVGDWRLLLMWAAFALLFWWIQVSVKASQGFDPFEILGVPRVSGCSGLLAAQSKQHAMYGPALPALLPFSLTGSSMYIYILEFQEKGTRPSPIPS
jgi:translocation protein SEC63